MRLSIIRARGGVNSGVMYDLYESFSVGSGRASLRGVGSMEETNMQTLVTAIALTFALATVAYADDDDLTEQQVEGVQNAIKAMGCTVEDDEIELENGGYEADDVKCDDGEYDVYLDKDFKVTKKVKED
jgi:hypothetical protein